MPVAKRKRASDWPVDSPAESPVQNLADGGNSNAVDSLADSPVDNLLNPAHNPAGSPVDHPLGYQADNLAGGLDHGADHDIDSSEVESEDDRVQTIRFGHYGVGSINALVEQAADVRLQSKRDYKTKKDINLSPGSQAAYMLWSNRWVSFRTLVLNVPGDSPITGQQVERCITSYAKEIVKTRKGQPLVVGWAADAVRMISIWAVDNIKGFSRLTYQEASSISKTLKWMVRQKLLTTEFRYEKTTAGFGISAVLVRRFLLSTVLKKSIQGQQSSRMLQICGVVVLLVATAGRTGDLTLSNGYEREVAPWQFLRYSDIKIHVGGSTIDDNPAADNYTLSAEIVLRAQKHQKDQETKGNRAVRLSFDPSVSTMFMNPIIWLLILGLRSGALVVGDGNGEGAAANNNQTYKAVIEAALATKTRLIKWTASDRPVFHQFTTRCEPIHDKPSTANTTINAVQRFMRETGIDDLRVTPYSFRRGAIQDVHNLEGIPAHNERHAQAVAGHTHRTAAAGMTKLYAGDQRIEYFNLVDKQQERLVDHFNPLHEAVVDTTASTTLAASGPSTAAHTPGLTQATITTSTTWSSAAAISGTTPCGSQPQPTAVAVNDKHSAAQAVFDSVDELPSLEDDDLVDDDDELWDAAMADLVDQPVDDVAAQSVEHDDLIDDDDELWDAAMAGLGKDKREAVTTQPAEDNLIEDDDDFWSTAFGGLAEEPLQPMYDLVDDSHGELESAAIDETGGESSPPIHGLETGQIETPEPATADIGMQILLALPTGKDDDSIARELPPLEDESGSDKLQVASVFVDTLVNLADEPWRLGSRNAAQGPVDTQRFADCGGGIHRCLRCFRVYRNPESAHTEAHCAAAFTAELWESPTVDDAGNVTWTCKTCEAKLHSFSSIKYHVTTHTGTDQESSVLAGYSRQGEGSDSKLRCLRCRRTVPNTKIQSHNAKCLEVFDPTTWTISEDEGKVTWTCMFCNKLLKTWAGVMIHLCAARRNNGPEGVNDVAAAGPGVNNVAAAHGVNGVAAGEGVNGVAAAGPGVNNVAAAHGVNNVAAAKQGVDGVAAAGPGVNNVAAADGVDGVAAGEGVDGVAAGEGVDGVAAGEGVDGVAAIQRRCPYCPKVYLRNRERVIEQHIRDKHPGMHVPDDINSHMKKPFKCPRGCTGRYERYTSQARLNLHLRKRHGEGSV